MKKILSLALASAMVVAALPVAYAAENEADYSAGTQITLVGTQENQGAQWTVTVPAKMVPGDKGTVKAEGMWNSDKFLAIGAPENVTLAYGAQSMDVGITWTHEDGSDLGRGFALIGNSVDPVSKEVDIAVEDASRLFGTWEGTIVYTVALIEKGDVNRDGVINADDATYIQDKAATPDYEFTAEELLYGDINNDGEVKGNDAMMLSQMVSGIRIANSFWNSLNPSIAAE